MNIPLHVAVGLGSELVNRLYGSYARRIREIASNSIDAGAHNFYMNFDPSFPGGKITFLDDGSGMTEDVIRSEFLNIGGSRKRSDPTKIGRIGIGFLAMAGLGHDIKLETRSRHNGSFQELTLSINAKELFNEVQRTQDITKLNVAEIEHKISIKPPTETFTYIEITNLTRAFAQYLTFNEEQLIFELRRILPLPYPDNCPLFQILKETDKGPDLISYLKKLNTISFWYRDSGLFTRLVYYEDGWDCIARRGVSPEIWSVWVLDKQLPLIGKGNPIRLRGYLVLTNSNPHEQWRGLVTRVKNVAVEENGWLTLLPGQVAVRARLTGELFIDGLDDNKALNMDRTAFNNEFDEMVEIIDNLYQLVTPITTESQTILNKRKEKDKNKTVTSTNTNTGSEEAEKPSGEEHFHNDPANANSATGKSKAESDSEQTMQEPSPRTNTDPEPPADVLVETTNKQNTKTVINYKNNMWKVLIQDFEFHTTLGNVVRDQKEIHLNAKHPLASENNSDVYKLGAFLLLLQNPSDTEGIEESTKENISNAVDLLIESIIKGIGA